MKYPLYIFCIFILLSCKSRRDFAAPDYKYEIIPEYIHFDYYDSATSVNTKYNIITEYLHFDCYDSVTYVNTKYNIIEKYVAPGHHELLRNNKLFYTRNNQGNNTLYEVYKSRFLLISYFPIYANGYYTTKRDSILVYDMETEKSYNLLANRFILVPYKTTPPRFSEAIIKKIQQENITMHATIDTIDIANNRMVVLLGDSITRDTVVLQPIISTK